MKVLAVKQFPALQRTVVQVVLNEGDPKWLHEDRGPSTVPGVLGPGLGTFSPAPAGHTGDTVESANACKLCRLNWKTDEFVFDGEALQVKLNKWGNPVHDGQNGVGQRPKVADEFYTEVRSMLAVKGNAGSLDLGQAPRMAAPIARPEVEPEFELVKAGEPALTDGVATQRYKLLRYGVSRAAMTVGGKDAAEFEANKTLAVDAAKAGILAKERQAAALAAITGSV